MRWDTIYILCLLVGGIVILAMTVRDSIVTRKRAREVLDILRDDNDV